MTVYQLLRLRCNIKTGKKSSWPKQGRNDGGNGNIKENSISIIFRFETQGETREVSNNTAAGYNHKKELLIFTLTLTVVVQTKN